MGEFTHNELFATILAVVALLSGALMAYVKAASRDTERGIAAAQKTIAALADLINTWRAEDHVKISDFRALETKVATIAEKQAGVLIEVADLRSNYARLDERVAAVREDLARHKRDERSDSAE